MDLLFAVDAVPLGSFTRDGGLFLNNVWLIPAIPAVSFFLISGAMALTGTMVIGPRLGGRGPDGKVRNIPGKSTPAAAVGALLVAPGLIGVLTPLGEVWRAAVADAAVHLLIGAAVGALIGMLIGALVGFGALSWFGRTDDAAAPTGLPLSLIHI